ncbi:helix-turn-helix transcriptional regulator [Nonomuraea jiangxiensis]|uniref:Regulatory protein, luxR family n=1 Tax=Nonomuraea jiangxiensis TaxID=633440 RepID=A0A1G9CPQ8_9ACTN|nr:helix-turn-helix transcriptional regulator [Nonomuraea jiangxiensis]SDK53680.1 regulatory protein, luxR family [Nonomuraea jiangxiensis]
MELAHGGGEASATRLAELLADLLPDEIVHGYAQLIDQGDCEEKEAARLVGSQNLLDVLMERGLAHRALRTECGRTVIRPTDPTLAFRGVLHGLQERLAESSSRLIDAHQRINDIQRVFSRRMFEHEPEEAVRVLTDGDEIQSLSISFINSAQSDYLGLHTWRFTVPLRKEEVISAPASVVDRKVRRRSIYSTEYFDNEVGYHFIQNAVNDGFDVRIYRNLPMKMKLVDEDAAMVPLTPSGASGIMLIRAPVVVKALRQYFELLWNRATSVGTPETPSASPSPGGGSPSELHLQLLRMMALGLKDESIANRTGMSLRTVRRHIASIMEDLSVETRFAAGVAAAKRGWID